MTRRSSRRSSPRRKPVRRSRRVLIKRSGPTGEREAVRSRSSRVSREVAPGPPTATLQRNGAAVGVRVIFGQAQHGTYTIQLFDPTGRRQLAVETGVNTDGVPDEFTLAPAPAELDQHLLQWSGAVDAFTSDPGQRFSVTVEVLQNGQTVAGGRVQKTGPLDVTQAFLGILRLVAA